MNTESTESPAMAMDNPESISNIKRPVICVFCGSAEGNSPAHAEAARALAYVLHTNNISLVYGGGTVGLMGELARTLVSLSGPNSVHGIIPGALQEHEQKASENTTLENQLYGRTTVVKDLATRKELFRQEVVKGGKGGGFIALSGGFGTMEELMEFTTWNQHGIHEMGVVAFNVEGYYDGLIQWVKTAVSAGFIKPSNAGILKEALTAEDCVAQLRDYQNSEDKVNLQWDQK
ncbi:MAG: hypothetical protein M1812_007041 [Candelaria pacifica]|nr:MAG: hypothetical protein M1812_007041 [Candelaria pacifica]